MWEVAVVVLQLACVVVVVVGAILSFRMSWSTENPAPATHVDVPAAGPVVPAEHEASTPNAELKRAA